MQNDDHLLTTLTQEEHDAVLTKIQSMVQMPAGQMPRDDELYLEQQLTDMLGFEVSAELEGNRLPHTVGTVAALPHLRRYPSDTLKTHDQYQEAGLSDRRSSFGWFTELGQLTPQAIQREKYYLAIHADFLPQWQKETSLQKEWWKYRKMIVINPFAAKAMVTAVADLGPPNWLQEQFGGSPEVIRDAELWSLPAQGHALVLFVNDSDNQLPLGPVSLAFDPQRGV